MSALCPYQCVLCESATNCSSCQTGFYLQTDSFCYSTCPNAFYYDNSTNVCQSCPLNCTLCFRPTYCTECSALFYLTPSNLCVG